MSGSRGFDPESGFFEDVSREWQSYTREGMGMWQSFNKKFAESYRKLLDQQLAEDHWTRLESEMTRKAMEFFLELVRSQRESRRRFLEMQKAIVDRYLESLEDLDEEESQA